METEILVSVACLVTAGVLFLIYRSKVKNKIVIMANKLKEIEKELSESKIEIEITKEKYQPIISLENKLMN